MSSSLLRAPASTRPSCTTHPQPRAPACPLPQICPAPTPSPSASSLQAMDYLLRISHFFLSEISLIHHYLWNNVQGAPSSKVTQIQLVSLPSNSLELQMLRYTVLFICDQICGTTLRTSLDPICSTTHKASW